MLMTAMAVTMTAMATALTMVKAMPAPTLEAKASVPR
jgi:hypothetical protein